MKLTPSLWRILLTNVAPSFASSCLLLYITELKETGLLSLGAAGLILSSASVAAFLGPLITARITLRLGSAPVAWAGFLLFVAGLSLVVSTLQIPLLVIGLFAMVLAYMFIIVLVSAELSARMPEDTHSIIAVQLGATAVGGMLAGPFAAFVLRLEPVTHSLVAGHWLGVVCLGVTALCMLPALTHRDFVSQPAMGKERFPWQVPLIRALLMLAVLHGLCDVAAWNWMNIWLRELPGATRDLGAALISFTWLASLTGRGVTILIARRAGHPFALRIGAAGAAAAMLGAYLASTPQAFILAFCLYCVCAAANLPGLIAVVSARAPRWRTEMTGLLMASVNGAGAMGTFVIGRLGDWHHSASAGMPLAVLAMALFALLVWVGPWFRTPLSDAPPV